MCLGKTQSLLSVQLRAYIQNVFPTKIIIYPLLKRISTIKHFEKLKEIKEPEEPISNSDQRYEPAKNQWPVTTMTTTNAETPHPVQRLRTNVNLLPIDYHRITDRIH